MTSLYLPLFHSAENFIPICQFAWVEASLSFTPVEMTVSAKIHGRMKESKIENSH